MDMVIDRKLVLKEKSGETIVYPAQYYYLELNTARMLNELNIVCPEDKELVRHRIELIEKETGTVLDEMQKKAITEAADHGLYHFFPPVRSTSSHRARIVHSRARVIFASGAKAVLLFPFISPRALTKSMESFAQCFFVSLKFFALSTSFTVVSSSTIS